MSLRRSTLAALALLAGALSAPAQISSRLTTNAPIVNFRLPTFTPSGHRDWLIRGAEARLPTDQLINLRDLMLTIFSGDAADRVDTILLSPAATIHTDEQVATGEQSLRVIGENFEATGLQWRYDHRARHVTIHQQVRVSFTTELRNLLQ